MSTPETYRAIGILDQEWGMSNITSTEDYSMGGYHNGVVKILDGENTYAFKPYPSTSERLVIFTSRVLNHLEKSGFQNFPRLIPTSSGRYYAKTQKGDYGMLSPWIDGEPISKTDPNDIKLAKLNTLARVVAEFHNATDSFAISEDSIHDETMSESWVPEMIERHINTRNVLEEKDNIFEQLGVEEKVYKLVKESGPFMAEMSDSERIRKIERTLTKGIIHADLWIGHWLFTDNDNVFLIDFDRMRHGRRLDDVERIISESMDLGIQYPRIILNEYSKHIHMSETDSKSLPMYLRYSVVRRAYWLTDQYIRRGTKLVDMPLNLAHEVEKATNILNVDIESLLS